MPKDAKIVSLYQQGYSGHHIARELGCSHEYVYRRLRFLGIPRRNQSEALKLWRQHAQQLGS